MDVITMESSAYKHLMCRISNMESMMLEMTKLIKQQKEVIANIQPEFISREQAKKEFQISLVTVDTKIKKYGVSRQKAGAKLLLNRLEFIKTLNEREPIPKVFNR